MMRMIWVICAALICFPLPVCAFGKISPTSTIAVIDLGFKGENVASDPQSRIDMAKVVTEYIGFHLERETQLVVCTAESSGYALDEQALALTGGFTQDRAIEIGKAMKADYILCGNILAFGIDRHFTSTVGVNVDETKATTKLSLQLIDARTNSILASAIADGVSGSSSGGTSLPMLVAAFAGVHPPVGAYMWDNATINEEVVDNSLTKAANLAVEKLLEKVGLLKLKQGED